ncbi:DUF881 domain-containing protein [Rhodococcus sp. ABRD24]|uniref:DUF881 domain-containing protein n=1 Tax=Rhodococcus sp. ABRD24 TaxID=2507582 RepID=UPI00103C30B9|nr:DUF881 domain-containing protein [Rhodococcus sp. ABRD24]QBJ94674.1 DUF881 domain-containing protein [Rhodococcus sp. ABRD24]
MSGSPRQVRRNPVPSLLKSLMTEHLDPGYAGAANDRDQGHSKPTRVAAGVWIALGALLIGLVFGIAYAQATAGAPDASQERSEMLSKVRAAEERGRSLATNRDELTSRADEQRASALAGDAQGAEVLGQLRLLEAGAATEPVHGPGLVVTLTDLAARPDLSDSSQRVPGSPKAGVLDRDLQSVVNALWASGAEAVAVGDVRVGPAVTIRQAGGAMLVDNQPVPSPYRVSAIGPPGKLQTGFVVSDAFLRMSAVRDLYGVGFSIAETDDLSLPAAAGREIRFAQETGAP